MTTEKHDPWALLREARKLIHTTLDIDALHDWACESDGDEPALDDSMYSLRGRIDAALVQHEADENHRQGYGDRLIALAKAEERKQHFQQGYSDAILDGLKREDALKRADEYAEEKTLGWK